jgi:hypothetical protein
MPIGAASNVERLVRKSSAPALSPRRRASRSSSAEITMIRTCIEHAQLRSRTQRDLDRFATALGRSRNADP